MISLQISQSALLQASIILKHEIKNNPSIAFANEVITLCEVIAFHGNNEVIEVTLK